MLIELAISVPALDLPLMEGMERQGQTTPMSDHQSQQLIRRHLLGMGILVVTMVSGYLVYGRTDGAESARVASTSVVGEVPEKSDAVSRGIDAYIEDVAARYGVSKDLIAAMIEAESSYNPRAISPRGAQGLMQLMPETAAILRVSDPFDPRENIDGGVRHLLSLMDRFDNNLPLALAAYNAGERAVIRHRGIPPYRETRQYVKRIMRQLDRERPEL
jgi:soluble lytic murein transglycosylase-like protein